MSTPPGLLGAAFLLWGWQTGRLVVSAIIALGIEGSRFVRWRWELGRSEFDRISDLCMVVFLGTAIYHYAMYDVLSAGVLIFQWVPLIFLPLLIAQVYSRAGELDATALFFLLRGMIRRRGTGPATINLAYPYFALCVLSASKANVRTPWFYVAMVSLCAWALWFIRSRRFWLGVWGALVILIALLGYPAHVGLHRMQKTIETQYLLLMSGGSGADAEPSRNHTAIGRIGVLKQSDRIVLRVKPGPGHRLPMLLRDASYNSFGSSIWVAGEPAFTGVQPESDGTTWILTRGIAPNQAMSISGYLTSGKGLLALPEGTAQLEHLPVSSMKRNPLGAVQVEGGPGVITYGAVTGQDASLDSAPTALDLQIPKREAAVLSTIATELGLGSRSPREILEAVRLFFAKNFRYSLSLAERAPTATALGDFLLYSRSGHCEYFATATVLLLRAAGLPARYATGYLVHEYSRLEKMYVVRSRHAHSWALVYFDGAWHDLDTTPPSWIGAEEAAASSWQPVYDLWSWVVFRVSQWRWREIGDWLSRHIAWLLVPLVVILAWRLFLAKRVVRPEAAHHRDARARTWPGQDSEFYLIERRLSDLGLGRYPWEPVSNWVRKLRSAHPGAMWTDPLESIASLHSRFRFDPMGMSGVQREALRAMARSWLEKHETLTSRQLE